MPGLVGGSNNAPPGGSAIPDESPLTPGMAGQQSLNNPGIVRKL